MMESSPSRDSGRGKRLSVTPRTRRRRSTFGSVKRKSTAVIFRLSEQLQKQRDAFVRKRSDQNSMLPEVMESDTNEAGEQGDTTDAVARELLSTLALGHRSLYESRTKVSNLQANCRLSQKTLQKNNDRLEALKSQNPIANADTIDDILDRIERCSYDVENFEAALGVAKKEEEAHEQRRGGLLDQVAALYRSLGQNTSACPDEFQEVISSYIGQDDELKRRKGHEDSMIREMDNREEYLRQKIRELETKLLLDNSQATDSPENTALTKIMLARYNGILVGVRTYKRSVIKSRVEVGESRKQADDDFCVAIACRLTDMGLLEGEGLRVPKSQQRPSSRQRSSVRAPSSQRAPSSVRAPSSIMLEADDSTGANRTVSPEPTTPATPAVDTDGELTEYRQVHAQVRRPSNRDSALFRRKAFRRSGSTKMRLKDRVRLSVRIVAAEKDLDKAAVPQSLIDQMSASMGKMTLLGRSNSHVEIDGPARTPTVVTPRRSEAGSAGFKAELVTPIRSGHKGAGLKDVNWAPERSRAVSHLDSPMSPQDVDSPTLGKRNTWTPMTNSDRLAAERHTDVQRALRQLMEQEPSGATIGHSSSRRKSV